MGDVANEHILVLDRHRRELLEELVREQEPAWAKEHGDALERRLSPEEAQFLKQFVQTELLKTGFRADGEPTERGLDLEEIINALYRQYPS